MTRYLAFAAAFLALLAASYGFGHRNATVAFQARLDAAARVAQAQAIETAKALAAAEDQRRALQQSLEDAAIAEPVANAECLPASRVIRLNTARR